MKRIALICTLSLATLGLPFSTYAQKEEIKAYQEMNKDLLKAVRKQYKTDPKVEYKEGNFYIVLEGKVNKQKMIMVLNEDGVLLTPEPVNEYKPLNKNYIYMGTKLGDKTYWGAANYNSGDLVLEPAYYHVTHCDKRETAGKDNNGIWRDATDECWVAYSDGSNKTYILTADGKNVLREMNGNYSIVANSYVKAGSANAYGLYDLKGREIYGQSYKDFEICKDGYVISSQQAGATFYGGKTINPELPDYTIMNNVLALKWDNGVPHYKVHKDDDWVNFAENPVYKVEYIDEGQKYYDWGDNEKVIAYYEGEGLDAPHGGYYMGLASKNIADIEFAKLEWTIRTLKDSKTYYYPVEWPEQYSFNSMILGGQYTIAQDYFDRFLKNSEVDQQDARLRLAKKYRGEAAVSKTKVARKIEEYTEALTAASKKYAIEKQNAAIRQANQEALSNSIATGIANILFGK